MKDLIAKITASKTSKIIACLIIALPIWLVMTFVDFTPDVETSVTVTETQTENSETTKIDYLKNLSVSKTDAEYFASNEYFGIAIYNLSKDEIGNLTDDKGIQNIENNLISTYKIKLNIFSKSDTLNFNHTNSSLLKNESGINYILHTGVVNNFSFKNIYTENENSIQVISVVYLKEETKELKDSIKQKITEIEKEYNLLNVEKFKENI